MTDRNHLKSIIWIVCIVVLFILTSCAPDSSTGTDQTAESTVAPTATATIQPPTATPALPTVMLVYTESADPDIVAQTQAELEILAEADGLVMEVIEGGLPEVLTSNVEVVVGVGQGLDLSGLAASSPETKFIVLENPDAVPSENLSVIGDPTVEAQQQVFMAGYLAALVSSDYKVAGLFSSDTGSENINAFVIGAEYFCGLCQPEFPPYNDYPLTATFSSGGAINAFESTVDNLISSDVEILYLQGTLVSQEKLTYLSEVGLMVVSDSAPDMRRNNWIGTVSPDPVAVLSDIWEDMMAGSVGVQVSAPIALIENDAGLVSEGRKRLFDEMAADVMDGLVAIELVP